LASLTRSKTDQRSASDREEVSRKKKSRWWLLYVPLGLIVASILAFNIFRPITVLPRIALAPGFALTNQDGQMVTNEDYRGGLTLYSFSHAGCESDCSLSPERINGLRQQLEQALPAGAELQLATISLNPENDTPADLAESLAGLQMLPGDKVSWDFLTGDPTLIRYVVGKGFQLYYKNDSESSTATKPVQFDGRYVLVDQLGIMRAEYLTADPDVDIIVRDVGLITQEAENSTGATSVAYEAAHLFLCYPR
jgi:protein SCO1/2